MVELLSYNELLDIIENFMNETRIRKFCSNICKGLCCHDCYTSNINACFLNESRRITCSLFICDSLSSIIFNEAERALYKRAIEVLNTTIENNITDSLASLYFCVHSQSLIDNVKFEAGAFKWLTDKNLIGKIYVKMLAMCSLVDRIKHRSKIKSKLLTREQRERISTLQYLVFKGVQND